MQLDHSTSAFHCLNCSSVTLLNTNLISIFEVPITLDSRTQEVASKSEVAQTLARKTAELYIADHETAHREEIAECVRQHEGLKMQHATKEQELRVEVSPCVHLPQCFACG